MQTTSQALHTGNREESDAKSQFLQRYPDYLTTPSAEDLRATEYQRLDALGHIYLDYTGGGIHADSQVTALSNLLISNVFGNPHSINPTSQAITGVIDRTRQRILEFFNAPPDEYEAIFTANASGGLRIVGEAFPFADGSHFALTFDNHNSVNGIREFASKRGAEVTYLPLTSSNLRIDDSKLGELLSRGNPDAANLFAFPAQSNFSGVQHDLDWIERAHAQGWSVLLDAAAFVPTNALDLSIVKPDFVPMSFYKMFGFPTGVGCLIAKKTALSLLQRPWFGGGTISLASVQQNSWHSILPDHAGFEDGTVNYLLIPGVGHGLQQIEHVGIDAIHSRVQALTAWTLEHFQKLDHDNGRPLVAIYGPSDMSQRGGTISFSVMNAVGTPFDFRVVEKLAASRGISFRTGWFCNPGAGETAHALEPDDMGPFFEADANPSFDSFFEATRGKGKYPGTIRISFGIASNFEDAYSLVDFIRSFSNLTDAQALERVRATNQDDLHHSRRI